MNGNAVATMKFGGQLVGYNKYCYNPKAAARKVLILFLSLMCLREDPNVSYKLGLTDFQELIHVIISCKLASHGHCVCTMSTF